MEILLVAVGGGLGATLRYVISYVFEKKQKPFYLATCIVNTLGSFIMGICLQTISENPQGSLFFITGLLGGLTTFSTFAYDILQLHQQKNKKIVGIYSLGTLLLASFMISLGYYLAV